MHATRIVPIRHPVRAKSSGIFLLGVLSAKWAIIGPEIRETKPWIVSSAVVRLWVCEGSKCRRSSSIYPRMGTMKPKRKVS